MKTNHLFRIRRRGAALALALCLLAGGLPTAAAGAHWGDLQPDGTVNAADALLTLQASVKLITLGPEQIGPADVNADGQINAADALLILQHSVKLIDRFPAEAGLTVLPFANGQAFLQTAPDPELTGARTIAQVANPYDERLDLPADTVMLYVQNLGDVGRMAASWADSGRDLSVMTSAGRDTGSEFFRLYPERGYRDVHTSRNGDLKLHTGTSYYMLPTRYYTAYKLQLVEEIVRVMRPTYLCLEEPEVFVYDTYADGFKEEWEAYYGEPWQDPLGSAAARYKASRLITKLWVDMYRAVRQYLNANAPDVKLLAAAHDILNYDHHQIVSIISTLTREHIIDGLIGQTWSDCIYGTGSAYGGGYPRRLFERAWIEYASYADAMQDGQHLFTLSDAKADNSELTWDTYEKLWKLSVATQLLMPDLQRFQSYIWPSRAFSNDVPDAYKTKQLAVFHAMQQAAGSGVELYAGTPGVALGMSDTLTYQYGSQYMPVDNTQDGIHSLSLPLIERGIPLEVKILDDVRTAADLDGVDLLILSYDIQKPVDPAVNEAVAAWVKAGGALLYVGGHDAAETLPGEWWTARGQTPLQHLLTALDINAQIGTLESFTMLDCAAPTCPAWKDLLIRPGLESFTATFTGDGLTPLLTGMDGEIIAFSRQVGQGTAVVVGLPSSFFAKDETGPECLRQLARYVTDRYSRATWAESDLMVSRRGRYLTAQALDYTDGEHLTGRYIDLFADDLPLCDGFDLQADETALLYDLADLQTPGTPRLAYAGGETVGTPTETADQTVFTLKGPADSVSACRLLGNGRTPQSVRAAQDGKRVEPFTWQWDNTTGSLLVRVENSIASPVTVTVTWGDAPLPDTAPYTWQLQTAIASSAGADAAWLQTFTGTAGRTNRRVKGQEQAVYRFDVSTMPDGYIRLRVAGNYRVEVSADGAAWRTAAVQDAPVNNLTNRTAVTLFCDEDAPGGTLWVRLTDAAPSVDFGGVLMELTVASKQPIG